MPIGKCRQVMPNGSILIFDSYALALAALGPGRQFRYSQTNTDGVPSPGNSVIGLT